MLVGNATWTVKKTLIGSIICNSTTCLFVNLFNTFFIIGKYKNALFIFFNVPLALIDGVFGLLISGEYLSIPTSVGLIALFIIAMQTDLCLLPVSIN